MPLQTLLPPVIAISKQAGAAILDVYGRDDHQVEIKNDLSPLTAADLAAHRIIAAALGQLTPELPVLSEESVGIPWEQRRVWTRYWLVDPLDGTKEFIKRNGEFTVNIALIDRGVPVLGVVYVPVLDVLYYGAEGVGAWKQESAMVSGNSTSVEVRPVRISTAAVDQKQRTLRVVASRNHRGAQLDSLLAELEKTWPELELVSMGSSLKICLVAEGRADIYPRLALTSEWDTAAAQAVLEAAGGMLVDAEGKPYRYNRKAEMLNPYFYALGNKVLEPVLAQWRYLNPQLPEA